MTYYARTTIRPTEWLQLDADTIDEAIVETVTELGAGSILGDLQIGIDSEYSGKITPILTADPMYAGDPEEWVKL